MKTLGIRRSGKAGGFTSRAIVVCAVTLAALQFSALAAQAYTVHKSGNFPGTATVPSVYVQQPYASTCTGSSCTINIDDVGHITNQARTIFENPTYKAQWQYVCVTHRLWRYDPGHWSLGNYYPGNWVLEQKSTRPACAYISPSGTSVTDAGQTFNLLMSRNEQGKYFATDVVVTWQLQNGTLLGKKTYDYTDTADYTCATYCTFKGTGITDDGSAVIVV